MWPNAQQIQSLARLADQPIALILGNETNGCTQNFIDQADLLIQIPMSSDIESLNVAIAAGISIYELKMKLVLAMLIHKIYHNLGRQVGVTANLIRQALDVELKRVTDLSAMQVILLLILKCDGFMSLAQIEKDTDEHEDGLEFFLEPLILKHYIVSEIRSDGTYFGLTKLGEEFVAKLWPVIEKTEAGVLKDFSDSERAQLIEYLARMQANCHEIIGAK